jgi:2-dehydro-3-deoxy-D-arabinonate dehydratase
VRIDGFPTLPALARITVIDRTVLALWSDGRLRDLSPLGLDELLALPLTEIRERLEATTGEELDPTAVELAPLAESQEVWAAGVTYLRSREARIEESQQKDIYERVYEAERPELFFKAAGWRVIPDRGEVGIRPDSGWDVPEPELAVLSNALGEVVAYACANDMSSRSIEGENPLYLPQAKIYDRSCSIGPVAVLAWSADVAQARMRMSIERDGEMIFEGGATLGELVRDPAELCGVLHSVYPLPAGAWLLTGTSIVPEPHYSAKDGDVVRISIGSLGTLVNRLVMVRHTGAVAPPRGLAGQERVS